MIDKGNKYCQVSKNTDKELLDGIMCKSKLKTKLLHSVKWYIKKLRLNIKDIIIVMLAWISFIMKEVIVKSINPASIFVLPPNNVRVVGHG